MQGIYMILNKIDQKCYVGQSVDIKRRWSEHKIYNYNYPLYNAFKKYGIDNFEFIVLEKLDSPDKDKMLEREIFWYELLQPAYNQVYPSQTHQSRAKKIIQINKNTLKIIRTFESAQAAAKFLNKSMGNISEAARGKRKSAYGYFWCYQEDYDSIEYLWSYV